jgi:ubiquinone/menaquinone biosynthesis C-methylase UbiE
MITDNLQFILRRILAFRRQYRVTYMLSKVVVNKRMTVIDIGCGIDGRSFDDYVPETWEITGVDIFPNDCIHHNHPNFVYVQQDAQDLSRFSDNEFELAVSIGMLEHITDDLMFKRIVSEIRRVAKQYIVAVPYRYCWVEPHYGVPFFPILPYSAKVALVKALNLSNHREAVKKDNEYIKKNYLWLSNAQYRKIFPDSTIHLMPTLEAIAIVRRSNS